MFNVQIQRFVFGEILGAKPFGTRDFAGVPLSVNGIVGQFLLAQSGSRR